MLPLFSTCSTTNKFPLAHLSITMCKKGFPFKRWGIAEQIMKTLFLKQVHYKCKPTNFIELKNFFLNLLVKSSAEKLFFIFRGCRWKINFTEKLNISWENDHENDHHRSSKRTWITPWTLVDPKNPFPSNFTLPPALRRHYKEFS